MAEPGFSISLPRVFDGGTIEDAFHGTSQGAASGILERRFGVGSTPGRFGPGVYFFESDYNAAAWWTRHENIRDCDAIVIRARVVLGRTLYLNMMLEEVERLRRHLVVRLGRSVDNGQAYTVLKAALEEAGCVDSLKIVRSTAAERYPAEGRVEVVVVVWDVGRATLRERLQIRDLGVRDELVIGS